MIFTSNTRSAVRWWKNGDHPLDNSVPVEMKDGDLPTYSLTEGEFVGFYQPPPGMADMLDTACGSPWRNHGAVTIADEFVRVCPGDWIVRGKNNHLRVVHPLGFGTEAGVEPDAEYVGKWSCRMCDGAGEEPTIDDASLSGAIHATEESHTVDVYGIAGE